MGRPRVGHPASEPAREPKRVLDGRAGGNVRRKRRTKYTWLPNLGTAFGEEPERSSRYVQLAVPADGTCILGCIPITFDTPQENFGVGPGVGLNDLVGNEYFLRRIVGKVFIDLNLLIAGTDIGEAKPVTVGAAFFVARAQSEAQDSNLPLQWSTQAKRDYNPLGADSIREPWIWRRTWRLGLQGLIAPQPRSGGNTNILSQNGTEYTSVTNWPPNNLAGSVLDGPHLDAKCARRVGQDDRLWFTVAAQADGGADPDDVYGVNIELDYRLLGALRKAKNSGTF